MPSSRPPALHDHPRIRFHLDLWNLLLILLGILVVLLLRPDLR